MHALVPRVEPQRRVGQALLENIYVRLISEKVKKIA
ncbi:unannotated protein [freshwater metagenome]|uniref:Unannotated protein n=1 Tax=freshwater metagenome TaxID=449393 RepID=A0A6J6CVK7_9ZZZZ